MLKPQSLNDRAKNIGLEQLMITNEMEEKKDGTEGKKRESYQVLHALAGSLALWGVIEAVTHLLQLVKVIGAEKADKKRARKREQVNHNRPTIFDPGLQEEIKETFQNNLN